MRFSETQWSENDRRGWAALWTMAVDPWPRVADLADRIGVARRSVTNWCNAGSKRRGSWSDLRGALLATARQHPEAVPRLVQAMASVLFDVDGTWIPRVDLHDLGDPNAELAGATIGLGRLAAAMDGDDPDLINQLADRLAVEALRAARAKVQEMAS